MQTLSSASRTHMALESASECTATVEMPISLHARCTRRAISPRFAMRILSNMGLADDRERLAELDGRAVLDQDLNDLAGPPRGHRVHGLHRLDDEQGLAGLDGVADLHEGGGAGAGLQVDGADHRRLHLIAGGAGGR